MADNMVVRVKYRNGYVDVDDGNSGRRRVIPFDAGNTDTRAAAIAIGEAVLDTYGVSPRRTGQVTVGDTPTWPSVGDAISTYDMTGTSTQRLLSRRVTFGENGKVQLDPTLNSPFDEFFERQAVAIKRLTNGTVGGRSSGGTPIQQVNSQVLTGVVSGRRIETWSFSPITETEGPVWEVEDFVLATKATTTLVDPFAAPPPTFTHQIRFEVYKNGGLETFWNILPGVTTYTMLGNLQLRPGDKLQVVVADIFDLTEFDLDENRATVQFTAAPNNLLRENPVSQR